MALKYLIEKLEDVAEGLRGEYKRREDGKYVLDVDGAVDKSKLDEFRNNNIELQKQIDKFKNIDPTKHAELLELQRKLQEKELLEKGDVDKLVALRVENMKTDYEGRLNDLTTKYTTANGQLSTLMIDNVLKTEAIKVGVLPTAVDDVVLRARTVYVIENGVPTPKGQDGKVIYGKDGQNPLAVGDWLKDLKKTAPHLFAGSQGSGAGGGNNHGGPDTSKMTAVDKIAAGLTQMQAIPAELRNLG